MKVKIADLMTRNVLTAKPHHSVKHVRKMMQTNSIHALPITTPEGEIAGIVSSHDLADALKDHTPVSRIMVRDVHTIPEYNGVHQAARLMRNNRIHHVVVTHEKRVVGILSAFDLLKLVEEHKFVLRSTPRRRSNRPGRRT